ncbi:MAG TPA: HAD hydrolase-like protein [Verrucomicrobiae bacterium]|nr:HAD hydrolase-like protein [Verrucomicrobiae bacterium]
MSRETIAVDLDDVLGDENGAIMHFSNKQLGLNHTLEDYTRKAPYERYWENIWKLGANEGQKHYEAFISSPYKKHLKPIAGAAEALKTLEKERNLVIVTSRREDMMEYSHEWLEMHFPQVFKEIHFVHLWDEGSQRATKAKICNEIGATYLIDDNLEHCTLAAEAGVQALLFEEYGWNRDRELPKGVVPVIGWAAVTEYFDARD